MSSFRIRPRFKRIVDYTPERVAELFEQGLARPDAPCEGTVNPGHITLRIPEEEQHYWSPQLAIAYEACEEGTEIRGLYGPKPAVWSAFFYGYAIIALLSLFLSMWGFSLMMLGKPAPQLWGLLGLGAGALALYLIAQTGQKVGAEQTFTLHHFFEETVGERVHIH